MPIAGFQDYWAVGVQAYFKRADVNSVKFPLIDLGTIESVSPTIEPTTIELFDNKSGRGVRVANETIRISESYDLTLNSLSPNNRALLLYANPPENIAYTQTERNVQHTNHLFIGGIFQVLDDSGNAAVPLNAIAAVFSGALDTIANVITAINVSTRTLTMASDQTATLTAGDVIIIHPDGLADPAKAGTYTILSITAGAIVLATALKGNSTNEAAVTVDLSHNQTTTTTVIGLEGTDWSIRDMELGVIETATGWAIPGGSLDTPIATARVLYQTAALTGRRLIKPQSSTGSIEGEMTLILSRGANAQRTLRRFNCSLNTGGLNFTADAYSSATITASITSDLTDVDIAGISLDFKGDIPSFS